jgi:hypothetical protein
VWTVALGLAAVLGLVLVVGARADDKEVTLEGKITCAKCDLKLQDKCATVIKTKDGKVYYFDTDSHKKNHKTICQEAKDGTVTGTVSKEGDKEIIKVSKVDFK